MLTSDSDIKREILDNWEYLQEAQYPEDYLTELADSAVPIYTGDIIEEWTDLPFDYRDNWTEISDTVHAITSAMSLDLYLYYRERYTSLYEGLCKDKLTEEE